MKTRTYIVTFVRKVYADVTVELPEEGFSAEFAITTAMHDIEDLSVEQVARDGGVTAATDWQFYTVGLLEPDGTQQDLLAAQYMIP